MHVKKNVCEATCGTLLKQKSKGKDHKNVREDLKELGIRSELYVEKIETGTNLPVAATTLSKAERKEFYQILHDLKVLSDLCLFFNAIEQNMINEGKLLDLERRHFETLCLLEATFPPSFFDLMLHPREGNLVPWPILPSSDVSI
jgi:hypothetical protein